MYKHFDRIYANIKNSLQSRDFMQQIFATANLSNKVAIRGRFLFLKFDSETRTNSESHKFPSIWLRDNCQCDQCHHRESSSRIVDWQQFNYALQPKIAKINASKCLVVIWNDGHTSTYDLDWLKERSFNASNRIEYLKGVYRPLPRLWSKDEFTRINENFEFDAVMMDPKSKENHSQK